MADDDFLSDKTYRDGLRMMEQSRREHQEAIAGITHRDGVRWDEAPMPGFWHWCKPWTVWGHEGMARCACGGLKYNGRWHHNQRFSRKKGTP